MSTITHLLERKAEQYGPNIFYHGEGEPCSFQELRDKAALVAANLAARGLEEHDKVLVLMGNSIEFLYIFFGLGRIGAVCVPVNPQLKPDEIAYIANNAEARMVITISEVLPTLQQIQDRIPAFKAMFVLGGKIPEGAFSFASLLEPVAEIPAIRATPDSEATLIYTSGTTGDPKGVILTHRNYVANALMMAHSNRIDERDCFLCVLPLFHVNAQVVTVLTPMTVGAGMALMHRFNFLKVLPGIAQFKPTVMSAVPTIYHVLSQMPRAHEYDISSIRFFVSGAAPLPQETYELVQRVLKKPLVQGYGLSEATCASAVADHEDRIKWDSVGPALRYTNVRIVDPQTLCDVPTGHDGEIWISGPTVMKGYYQNPQATEEVLKDGWLRTGDLGRFDHEGYLFVVGRIKDMIIRGGLNIYPQQIENALASLEGVAESCVVGVPESRWGQEVLAVVRRAENAAIDEAAVHAHCQRRLAAYKCPKYVRFMEAFPKTPTGKIKKNEVAALYQDIAVRDHHK